MSRQPDLFDPPPYKVTRLNLKGFNMNINDIFPSKYLKASEFEGRSIPAVIERWEIEALGDERKLILYFQGMKKGLVTNKTNADRIGHLYGPDTDDWIGREIVLYCDMTNFQGRAVEAIRVRGPERKAPSARTPNGPRVTSGRAHPLPEPPADDVPPWEPDR